MKIPEAISKSLGAVPGWTLVRHTWSPPDVNASEDFPATTYGGPVTPLSLRQEARVDNKTKLRAVMRALRRDHVAAQPAATKALLFKRPPAPVAALLPEGMTVGLYHPLHAEAPTQGYARWLYENERHIALPWFADVGAPMQFRTWLDPFGDTELVPGPHGVLQPAADAPEVLPEAVIVPLLAFTKRGERLGQGGGHYDRWLAAHRRVLAIGLAWDCQMLDELPMQPHDMPLRAVITPTRIHERIE
jgi:5-formyltetrahydrofolate cyclo-ligase